MIAILASGIVPTGSWHAETIVAVFGIFGRVFLGGLGHRTCRRTTTQRCSTRLAAALKRRLTRDWPPEGEDRPPVLRHDPWLGNRDDKAPALLAVGILLLDDLAGKIPGQHEQIIRFIV